LVPTSPEDPESSANQQAWRSLELYDRPFLCAFSDSDPVTAGGDAPFLAKVPGAQGREHPTMVGGGHFLQEDLGPELAAKIRDFITETA
jgi:haloalkane dehalogenase